MRVLRSRVAQTVLAVGAAYWVLAWLIPVLYLREVLDGIAVAMALVVLIIYLPITSEELLKHRLDRSGRLLLGIVLSWLSVLLLRPWSIYSRLSERSWWMEESRLLGFFLWIVIWAGVLHIIAPGADAPHPPRQHWWQLSWVLLIGGIVGGLIVGIRLGHWLDE